MHGCWGQTAPVPAPDPRPRPRPCLEDRRGASRGAAPEEDRRGRAAGHAPRRDARVLGPDRACPCAGYEAEAAPLPGGPSRSQPWSRARGGPPRPGGRARATPGCTGAGARPRPPLRRIRGRGRALARRQSSSLLVPTRRPSGPACARAGWRGRTLLTSVHMQSLGSPSRFGLPPPKLPAFSPLPVAPRDASRDSRVRPPDVYKLVLQMPLPPIVIHPLPPPRTTFLGHHQGASAGERAGGAVAHGVRLHAPCNPSSPCRHAARLRLISLVLLPPSLPRGLLPPHGVDLDRRRLKPPRLRDGDAPCRVDPIMGRPPCHCALQRRRGPRRLRAVRADGALASTFLCLWIRCSEMMLCSAINN
jgi:hypothetical protein